MLKALSILWRRRRIFVRTVLSDIRAMYSGMTFGLLWIVLGPMLLLALYSVIYTLIFNVRLPNFTVQEYVLNLFAGLVPFLAFAQALGSSASALKTGRKLLSNVHFPPEFVPIKAVAVAYVTLPVGLVITFLGDVGLSTPTSTWLLVPIVALLQILFSMGLAYFVSLISLVFRDIEILIQYIMISLLILTPIAYTPDMVPKSIFVLMYANPLFYFVFSYQNLILANTLPPAPVLIGGLTISLGTFLLGFWFFHRTRRYLSDLI